MVGQNGLGLGLIQVPRHKGPSSAIIIKIIKAALAAGEDVEINAFGKFPPS